MRVAAIVVALAVALAAGSACSGGGGNTKAFCDALHAGDNPLDVFDRYDPTNLATARDQLQRGVDRMKELEKAAPSEIRDDIAVLVDVGTKLVDALDPAAGAKPAPDFTSDAQRVKDASAAVTSFAADHCNVNLEAPSAGPTLPASS
jgi:leucyl aminopeptidase (aminopeptidase T)